MKKWKKRYKEIIDTVTRVLQAQLEVKNRNDSLENQTKQALADYKIALEEIDKEKELNKKLRLVIVEKEGEYKAALDDIFQLRSFEQQAETNQKQLEIISNQFRELTQIHEGCEGLIKSQYEQLIDAKKYIEEVKSKLHLFELYKKLYKQN